MTFYKWLEDVTIQEATTRIRIKIDGATLGHVVLRQLGPSQPLQPDADGPSWFQTAL
jgi:hypothetical protein